MSVKAPTEQSFRRAKVRPAQTEVDRGGADASRGGLTRWAAGGRR